MWGKQTNTTANNIFTVIFSKYWSSPAVRIRKQLQSLSRASQLEDVHDVVKQWAGFMNMMRFKCLSSETCLYTWRVFSLSSALKTHFSFLAESCVNDDDVIMTSAGLGFCQHSSAHIYPKDQEINDILQKKNTAFTLRLWRLFCILHHFIIKFENNTVQERS